MSDWSFNYWIRGHSLDMWNTVEVSQNTTIQELTARVFSDQPEINVAVAPICVYKVPDEKPVRDDNFKEDVLGGLSMSMLGKPLRNTRTLSAYFESVPQGQLHIVIDLLTLSIRCWIRGADSEQSVTVEASSSNDLSQLRKTIKNTGILPIDIPMYRLKLYKISTRDDELAESLAETGVGQLLRGTAFLQSYFDDVPFSTKPYVVVEWLEEDVPRPPPPSRRGMELVGGKDPIARARIDFLGQAPGDRPSNAGAPSSFRTRQLDSQQGNLIPCGRPCDPARNCEETIPTTLFHPVFAQFVDDCKCIKLTLDDHRFAEELSIAMSDLYVEETARFKEVNEVFQRHDIHFTTSQFANAKRVVNGDMSTNGHRYVIAEFRNEAGNTSAEPYFEAISYYQESTRDTAPTFSKSSLASSSQFSVGPSKSTNTFVDSYPSFAGPYIVFAGATWNLRPTIQILSTPIAFHFHSTDIHNQLTVSRHMAAFRKATRALKDYYDALRVTPLLTTSYLPRQIFPYPTSYTSLRDNTTTGFRYDHPVVERKLIFFGTEDNGDRICINFVRKYCRKAHQCLESLGCAPTLRGFQRISGDWIMMVMDALPADFETLYDRIRRLPPAAFDNIGAKLGKFHNAGFVHGDFRDVNIMASKSDEMRFMIIDFDWAGRKGKARYPPGVNFQDIARPLDAYDGKKILAAHDLFMLDRLRTRRGIPVTTVAVKA